MMSGLRAVQEWNLIFSHTSTTGHGVEVLKQKRKKKLHSSCLFALHFNFLENEREREFYCQWRRRSHYIVQVGATRKIWRIQQVKMCHFLSFRRSSPFGVVTWNCVRVWCIIQVWDKEFFSSFRSCDHPMWTGILHPEHKKFSKKFHVEISDLVWNQREHED